MDVEARIHSRRARLYESRYIRAKCGQKIGDSFGEFIWAPLPLHSRTLEFIWTAISSFRPRMQVRGGTPHAYKILHCNHAEGWAAAHWWTALQILLGQTDYRSGQMRTRR